ncbi:MAG: rubrerythrin family protein [Bacteroidales bacterium]|jgi:rubrerythrin|nr:rubrerythrin family protein [Bacteroidales bacterium]
MNIKGTKTEKNLLIAFAGESQARNRYTFFASKAKKEGYEQIAAIFEQTAGQEKEHAEVLFKYLEGGSVEFTAAFPAGVIGTTEENLVSAAAGENEEWSYMYPEFAKIADEEGFPVIAANLRLIASVEVEHEKRYLKLLENLRNDKVFKSEEETIWVCRNCGYHHKGKNAPEACPCCKHAKAYFELLCENY